MQPSDNGQQGVILGADTLHALMHSLDTINTYVGSMRLMVSSLLTNGAGDIRDLMVIEKMNRMTEEHAEQAYSVLANHRAAPYARLSQELNRRLGLPNGTATLHPLESAPLPDSAED